MLDVPGSVGITPLIGDQARAAMLGALPDGKALTAAELAAVAATTKQAASSHPDKLVGGGLVRIVAQGRHRYFQLANADVAGTLDGVMDVSKRSRRAARLPGPRNSALRQARRCYGHLAAALAVEVFDAFVARGMLSLTRAGGSTDTLALTLAGLRFFGRLNFDPAPRRHSRRPVCRPCLDWSMRRYHLAGSLGTALLEFCYRNDWAEPVPESRVVQFSPAGEAQFRKMLIT